MFLITEEAEFLTQRFNYVCEHDPLDTLESSRPVNGSAGRRDTKHFSSRGFVKFSDFARKDLKFCFTEI